ncbi:MAG: hypothetical protein O2954_18990, partial [bacterium]|nr:hypothetical protein [bacterium]
HCFGGRRIKATEGRVLARVMGASDGVVEHRTGSGWTLVVGPDLVGTILHVQQGNLVPPAVGPTRIDVIKGLALDLDRDRLPVPSLVSRPTTMEAIADEFRGIILRAIFQACRVCGVALPVLWYWPDNLPAIAHMSHDSDGGDEEHGWTLLNLTKEVGIKTTWCIMAGHYQPEFYEAIKEYDSEIALHYDAQSYQTASDDQKEKVAHLKWGYDELVKQLQTVEKAAGRKVTSNKNHTLRWQGRLEFFRWCAQAGITVEESRGPNTPYTNGFPFGGSHPWFPMDDEVPDGPRLDVLEVNLTVQDIHRRCSIHMAREFGNRVFRHYGIAHYLFHPAHTWDPAVRGGLRAIVGDMHDLGMEWWTADRIGKWERARRQVRFEANGKGYRVSTETDLEKATVLVLEPGEGTRVSVDGQKGERVERYGFDFQAVTTDLKAGQEVGITVA